MFKTGLQSAFKALGYGFDGPPSIKIWSLNFIEVFNDTVSIANSSDDDVGNPIMY